MPLNDSQIFWLNLEKIKDDLLISDAQFAQELQMSLKDYLKIRGTSKLLPLDIAFEYAEKRNFHFEDLFKIDFKLKLDSTSCALLDRYTYANYSQIKPVMSIVDYLEQIRGPRAKTNLLRKFQLSEDFLMDDANKANIFLVSDIASYMKSAFNFTDNEFILMGQRTPYVTGNNFLKTKLTNHSSAQSIFANFFEECTQLFDKNSTYRVDKMTDEFAIIDAIPKRSVIEELQISPSEFGNDQASLSRAGIISSMTVFQYNLNTPIKKISSLYHGDKYDRYLLDLSVFKKTKPTLRIIQ